MDKSIKPLKGKHITGRKPLKGKHIGEWPTPAQKEWRRIQKVSNTDFGLVSLPHNNKGQPYKTRARAEYFLSTKH
jgi:hypothetical protein